MVDDSKIPEGLRGLEQWVCWREEERGGKQTKVPTKPYDTSGSPNARTDESSHWRSFEAALTYHREGRMRTDGVGFVFTEACEVVGVDLDSCRDLESGVFSGWAEDVIERLDSYTEVSPSGTGAHVLVRGRLPPGRNRRGDVEMYDSGRFFTVTGEHVEGTPLELCRRQDAIVGVHREYVQIESGAEQSGLDEHGGAGGGDGGGRAGGSDGGGSESGEAEGGGSEAGVSPVVTDRSGLRRKFGPEYPSVEDPAVEAALHNSPPTKIPIPIPQGFDELAGPGVPLGDDEVLERAFASKSGDRIEALYRGESSLFEGSESRYPSQSEADMALLFYLAFWTGKDPEQMDRLFRDSGLMRSKWDRRHYGNGATYGRVCLARTLIEVTDYYEPPVGERTANGAEQLWGDEGEERGGGGARAHPRAAGHTGGGSGERGAGSERSAAQGNGARGGVERGRAERYDVSATEDARLLAMKVKRQHQRLAAQASYITDLETRLQWYREALGVDPPTLHPTRSHPGDEFEGRVNGGRVAEFDDMFSDGRQRDQQPARPASTDDAVDDRGVRAAGETDSVSGQDRGDSEREASSCTDSASGDDPGDSDGDADEVAAPGHRRRRWRPRFFSRWFR